AHVETQGRRVPCREGDATGVAESGEGVALHEGTEMKSFERKVLVAGVDGGDDDAPLGLVFPEALKGDLGDVEGTALPVGTSCHAATGQHDHGGEGSGQDESAHPPKIQ